jgi:acetyl-CoA carboxylase biotin carboxyl carrier protein
MPPLYQLNSNPNNTVDIKEIRNIVELMNEHELTYFHLEEEGVNLKLKKGGEVIHVPAAPVAPVASAAPAAPAPSASADSSGAAEAEGKAITAPMVGTFYTASSPDAAPYVNVGDTISAGQTLCIIEAMKVMNEIEAEVSGTITAIVAKDGEPVQFGDPLFRIQ